MTRSVLSSGVQRPRIESLPPGDDHPKADAAVELAAAAGLVLDPWQEHILRASLRRRDDRWAAFEVAAVLPRQNGKNGILEARELAGLFLLGERLIIHSAHLADTAKEAFRRLESLIDANEWLSREVKHVWRTNGFESIELNTGQRIRFRTRTKGGGRGFSGDCVIFDEAMVFPEASQQAIMPVVSARPDPQLWYTGSAVDQMIHDDGRVLTGVRHRGLSGDDESLAYFEWGLPYERAEDVPPEVAEDPEAWAEANPALGIRISADYVEKELRAFYGNPRGFAVERLGVGDWPLLDGEGAVINAKAWAALSDPGGEIVSTHVFAFDVSPDRAWGSVSVAGHRQDGLRQLEVVEHRRGTGWILEWLAKRPDQRVICDGRGPAGSLMPELEQRGIRVEPVTAEEHAKACGMLYDAVAEGTIRHLGDPLLAAAIAGAKKRKLLDRWAWDRTASGPDISPLVAATLALWGLEQAQPDAWMGAW